MGSRLHRTHLANGLQVLAAEVPEARQLRLVGAVGAGYLDEPMAYRGLAHLLEHALFLGSVGFPGISELSRWVGHLGGRYNACTGETTTDIHLSLPPEAAEEGLARLGDLLNRPLLVHERIAHEVGVLDAEYRARLADPALHRLAALGRLYSPGHPGRACHAGNRSTLGQDTERLVSHLQNFHRRHYRPERMALVMLGPQPLERQIELLAHHGHQMGASTASTGPGEGEARTSRWGEPGGIAWCLPEAVTDSSASILELLWPLPDDYSRTHAEWLRALVARLVDGTLTATLQSAFPLEALDVSLSSPGAGEALGMRLTFTELKPHHDDGASLSTLLATCHGGLARALQQPMPCPPRGGRDLDAWSRHLAQRLVTRTTHPEATDTAPPRSAFAAWLTPGQCRWLWHCPSQESIPDDAWHIFEETGTRYRRLPSPDFIQVRALPPRPAPSIAVERSQEVGSDSDAPGCLHQDRHLALWWGSLAWPASGPEASWCLGWPAESNGHRARLAQWRHHCLPLCQAAEAHGLTLLTGSDSRGDWLLASGDPSRLPSVVEQALKHWLTARRDAPPATTDPATGLIAQRMLCELESCSAPQTILPARPAGIAEPASALLCWARGRVDAETARQHAHRFADLLPPMTPPSHAAPPSTLNPSDAGKWEPIWLPSQGSDQAVMLEIAGQDDTPHSRILMQLMAQCHDSAFQHAMRQRHGFGYVAAVRYREAAGWPRLGYVVQSPRASVDTLRRAIGDFLQELGVALACLESSEFSQRLSRLAASQGRPETHLEAIQRTWQALRRRQRAEGMEPSNAPWPPPPWEEEQAALSSLAASDLTALADALVVPGLPRRWWLHAPR